MRVTGQLTKLIVATKVKKSSVTTKCYVLCMYMGDVLATCFGPKGPSSGNERIKISKKSYWVMGRLYIDDIWFVQSVGLY